MFSGRRAEQDTGETVSELAAPPDVPLLVKMASGLLFLIEGCTEHEESMRLDTGTTKRSS